jgi:MFS superfamily sulfate permease-like transporter
VSTAFFVVSLVMCMKLARKYDPVMVLLAYAVISALCGNAASLGVWPLSELITVKQHFEGAVSPILVASDIWNTDLSTVAIISLLATVQSAKVAGKSDAANGTNNCLRREIFGLGIANLFAGGNCAYAVFTVSSVTVRCRTWRHAVHFC